MAPQDIARFKFLLEAWDNLGYQSTLDPWDGVVELVFSPDREREVRQFLDLAGRDIPLVVIR